MRFEVPQFVDVEDKIFGPFTWKQFVYLAGGAGAGFMVWYFLPLALFIFVGGPIIALALGLAFYQVNNRPLSFMIEAIFAYFSHSRLYLWKKETAHEKQKANTVAPNFTVASHNNISSLARSIEMKALERDHHT
jgi:PrgI family protein